MKLESLWKPLVVLGFIKYMDVGSRLSCFRVSWTDSLLVRSKQRPYNPEDSWFFLSLKLVLYNHSRALYLAPVSFPPQSTAGWIPI